MKFPKRLEQIDPNTVRLPPWHGRWEGDLQTSEFRRLAASVACTGGNIQPVYVRPIVPTFYELLDAPEDGAKFQLIFGRRRLLACRECGVPLFALVTRQWPAHEQFLAAFHENLTTGSRLSAFEMGRMCYSALELNVYRNQRELAKGTGLTAAYVSAVVDLGSLSNDVIRMFHDPRRLRARWAAQLNDVHCFDRERMEERFEQLRVSGRGLSMQQTYEWLVGLAREIAG